MSPAGRLHPPSRVSRRDALIVALLVAAVWVVYAQAASFGFLSVDDNQYVTRCPGVLAGLSARSFRWALTAVVSSNWHPLTLLSHQLDVQLFGLNAGAHHLVNVLWHTASTVLLFFAFRRLTKSTWRSAFVAALFAVHPLHVESVAWVAERKDVLSAFFFALTLLLYAGYAEKPSAGRYGAALAAFAAGLLTKPMLVTLPCVLLLLDAWPLERWRPGNGREGMKPLRRLLAEKAPFFALSAVSCTVTLLTQRGALASAARVPLGLRVPLALQGYVAYLGKLFWPARLAVLYPLPASIPLWSAAASAALLAAVTVAVFRGGRRRPWLWVGWLWFLGMLVPVSGLVQVGDQAYADRYTYLPYLGLFVILAWGGTELAERFRLPPALRAAAAGAVLAALAAVAWVQAGHWRSSLALYSHALEVTPANCVVRSNFGVVLFEAGRTEDAAAQFAAALRIDPGFFPAHYNLAELLRAKGEYRRATWHYGEALRLAPTSREARRGFEFCRDRQALDGEEAAPSRGVVAAPSR